LPAGACVACIPEIQVVIILCIDGVPIIQCGTISETFHSLLFKPAPSFACEQPHTRDISTSEIAQKMIFDTFQISW
jgi:hypothetical protein